MDLEVNNTIKVHMKEHEEKMHPHGISRIFNKSSDGTFDCSMDVHELFAAQNEDKPQIV